MLKRYPLSLALTALMAATVGALPAVGQDTPTGPAIVSLSARFDEPWRTSPTANTPGMLVSKGKGGRSVAKASGGRSRPVSTKP